MKMNGSPPSLQVVSLALLVTLLGSCSIPGLYLDKYFHPVKRVLNKERNFWVDMIEYEGNTGVEAVYYRQGRPALERFFDANDLLKTISYFNRAGAIIRFDSLVYSNDRDLIAGYYFSEPEHRQILKFLNYKQQGQLSQRSWFGSVGELLSREFFLFDPSGNRRMRMVFDEFDQLLFSEIYQAGTDQMQVQNVYSPTGALVSQTSYLADDRIYRYDMNEAGQIVQISHLQDDGTPHWTSDIFYNQDGTLTRSNFNSDGRFLFSYTGDLELRQSSVREWRHPLTPSHTPQSLRIQHQDPFTIKQESRKLGLINKDFHLPVTGALFKRSITSSAGVPISDTLYSSYAGLHPAVVINYDSTGLVDHEFLYDLDGAPAWKHQLYRDDKRRIIREEVIEIPDQFTEAVTRFYDFFSQPAMSEHFVRPDSFDGSWLYYNGGGLNKILYYGPESQLMESWLVRPSGDTTRHSKFKQIEYITIESKYSPNGRLLSQRRFSDDGKMNWELFFDNSGRIMLETHRKMDGGVFKEISYDAEKRTIKSSTYAPVDLESLPPGAELKGELTSQRVSRLNKAGETIHVISMNSSGQREWERRFAYRNGRLVKSAQLGSEGVPEVISTFTHNERGQVEREMAYNKEDSLVHSIDYLYGENNELIQQAFTSNAHQIVNSNRLYYDEEGRLSRDEIIEDARFIEAINYTYYPEFFVRVATHVDPEGNELRKEIENYFGPNVFELDTSL
ncbi:MAG: hypothetical protein K9N38_04060 [Candidatus Marinimicrobia bacterium]|nr:hypothetical protein [Candidatus Neomarinimicrobiota bacterium]MCF7850597.1 hypothetical protein [Candidatus Neomarinimicrobiota bacterium]